MDSSDTRRDIRASVAATPDTQTTITQSPLGKNDPGNRAPSDIEDEAAREAAEEVAEATDAFAAGGIAAETAGMAEGVTAADLASGEDEITPDVRRDVGRSVFRLAWPAIAENALQTLLGIVDTAVVARLGTAALSGVGASQQLIWMLTTALIAVSMGTTVLVARFTGAGQNERASAVVKQSLLLATVVGFILIPIGFLSLPMLHLLGLDPQAANDGAVYLQITLQMSLLIVIMFVAGAALRGAGDTRTPMMVTAFINVINAVMAVELVFGGARASQVLGDWLSGIVGTHVVLPTLEWIPALGVAGSAWAAVIARGIGTLLLLSVYFIPGSRLHLIGGASWRPNFDLMRRILKIGIPSAVEQMLMSVGILIYSFVVIGLGEIVFATSRLALNAVFLSQMPGFGFAVAATTLVGQNLGAGNPKRARLGAYVSTRSALIWMSLMGVVFWFFGRNILMVFTDGIQNGHLGLKG